MLFTRNPVTGAAERVIEASWGLGEAVVAGLVVPDRFRLDARGRVLERTAGEKDAALRAGPAGTRRRSRSPVGPCTPPAWTTRSSPRCISSPRRATLSTARTSTTSSSPSSTARCSSCSDGRTPVADPRIWWSLGSALLASSLMPLNSTMIAVALPEIAREFARPPRDGGAGRGRELPRGRHRAAGPGRQAW